MNEKKSPFGDLCHQYRGNLHLSEQAMGQKIEELGYKLGAKPGSNKQPVISQFERVIDPEGAIRKQHRDPPLEYVEACAKLFELSSEQKYSLFVAALQSSEKIVFDGKAIEGSIKDSMIKIIASLIVSCTEADKAITIIEKNKNKLYVPQEYYQAGKIMERLNAFKSASECFIKEINQLSLEYKVSSS
jgi:hypothetical protein